MMKIKSPTVEFSQYDKDNPFDCAQEIIDEFEEYFGHSIFMDRAYDSIKRHYLNDKGEEVFACFDLIVHGGIIATNKGAPKAHYDRLLRFIAWANKYGVDTTAALESKKRYEDNNPESKNGERT